MRHRFTIPVLVAILALGGMAACGGKSEPEGPSAAQLERMRQDSIRAEEARRAEQAYADSIRAEREREAALARETTTAREIMEQMIHFGYDQSVLTAEAEQKLERKLAVMRANPDVAIRIAGHADERGSIEYNRALGQRRAEAAKDFLVSRGISLTRITTVSFGEDRPLLRASNEQAWAQNRRDEFTIVAGGDPMRAPGGP